MRSQDAQEQNSVSLVLIALHPHDIAGCSTSPRPTISPTSFAKSLAVCKLGKASLASSALGP